MIDHAIPPVTTVRRHRLALHIGYCVWAQELHDNLLAGGMVRWSTVDASPQGGHDWVTHGVRAVHAPMLHSLLRWARTRCRPGAADADNRAISIELERHMRLSQGRPGGSRFR